MDLKKVCKHKSKPELYDEKSDNPLIITREDLLKINSILLKEVS